MLEVHTISFGQFIKKQLLIDLSIEISNTLIANIEI